MQPAELSTVRLVAGQYGAVRLAVDEKEAVAKIDD